MSEWRECKLGDVLEIKYGKDHKKLNEGVIPVYGSGGIMRYADTALYDEESILIPRKGTLNNIFYINKPFWTVDTLFYTKPNKSLVNIKFLYYQLSQIDFNALNVGSAVPSLTVSVLNDVLIDLPELPEQKAIAAVLSSLDDKIDLLHCQNKTLEAMAETLFKQWFVVEAGEDLEECNLEDLCIQIASGSTPSTKIETYYNGYINWYSTKELKDNFLFESKSKISEDGLKNSSAKLFPINTVVMAIYAAPTVGRLGILASEASFNQAACGLIADEKICCTEFIYLYLKSQRNEFNLMASGSAQQNLNVGKIKTYPAFKVPTELMLIFKKVIKPIFNKISQNTSQIQTLETLRDNLLPKLMSGEVRVKY
ncbi:MAG: hypothetical protein RLZ75_64 [Pseudomonadota bacterium]